MPIQGQAVHDEQRGRKGILYTYGWQRYRQDSVDGGPIEQ